MKEFNDAMDYPALDQTQKPENLQLGTVLIVDDGPVDLRFAQAVITAACPQLCVRGVLSGSELLAYLEGENGYSNRVDFPYPTLVLLDLGMPDLHGFNVLKWLRNNPPHNVLPVVVLTVSGGPLVAQQAYELGARSFLTKPIKANDVMKIMAALHDWTEPYHPPASQMQEH
jgi:CheY-like chemotaxis protein